LIENNSYSKEYDLARLNKAQEIFDSKLSPKEVAKGGEITVYRGDTSKIDLKDYDVGKGIKDGKDLGGAFAEGPGIYFTTKETTAKGYGPNISQVSIPDTANIITDESPLISRSSISKMMKDVDKDTLDVALSNWSENKAEANKLLTDAIMNAENPKEQLINIWADVFYHQQPDKFMELMKQHGIDGIKVAKEGQDHYVIYNRDLLSKSSPKEVAKGGEITDRVYYHRTNKEFDIEDIKPSEGGALGKGIYLSKGEQDMPSIGKNVHKVTIKGKLLKIPYGETNDAINNIDKWIAKAKEGGYVGFDTDLSEIVIFDPKNISKLSPKEGTAKGGDIEPIVNIDRLNISDEAKTKIKRMSEDIKPDLKKLKGEKLTHEEVIEAAKTSEILKNGVSREATLNFEAQLLKTRQNLAALAEAKTVTKEFIDNLRAVSSAGTDIARSLESMKIGAESEYATVKIKIMKDLIKAGIDTDDIVKAAEGVDFTKQKEATAFYRKFIKPNVSTILDEYRYMNLLSSPKTHIVNTFSNIIQVLGLSPMTKLASGSVDLVGSQLSGKERQYYFKQVPSFYRGVINSAPKATDLALAVIRGEGFVERPDLMRIGSGIEFLQVIPRLLEAFDVFFRTMVYEGELEALKTNSSLTEVEKIERAKAKSEYYVFRSPIDPENKTGQGALLSSIDKLTRAMYAFRNVPMVKWFIPFVQTPMNIFKQGIEYSPLGVGTLPGSKDKTEQLGKALLGSLVLLWAASKGVEGKLTWSAPRGKKEKELFYASGRKPYSILIGDKWVGYSKIGPLAYPLAMAAAFQYYMNESPEALSDSDMEKFLSVSTGIVKFLSDQSYLQGIGDFQKYFSGDPYAIGKSTANIVSQVIPLSSLLRWANSIIDPFFRETTKGLSPQAIIDNVLRGIPGVSATLKPLKDSLGRPIKKEGVMLNALSPITIGTKKTKGEILYKQSVKTKQVQKKIASISEKAKIRVRR
jgi:hypothetical protein